MTVEALTLSRADLPPAAIVVAAGELDSHTVPSFLAALRDTVAAADAAFRVNVTAITFADSAGLRALVQARALAASHGATFGLDGLNGPLARLVQVTGLTGVLGPPSS